jgi:ribosome-binding protein aMBF1 (putative translation factor)
MSDTRTCRGCRVTLPITDFERASWVDRHGVRRYTRRHRCPDCQRAYDYRWELANPEKVAAQAERRRVRGDVPSRIRQRRRLRAERRETLLMVQSIIRTLTDRGYSYAAIARAAGLKSHTVANWASLEAPPRAWRHETVRRLCDAYVAIGGTS